MADVKEKLAIWRVVKACQMSKELSNMKSSESMSDVKGT